VQTVIRHEYGHVLTTDGFPVYADIVASGYLKRTPSGEYDAEAIAKHVSAYATTNQYEFAAEVFAKYTHPSYQKGSMPDDMERLAQDMIKKAKER